MIEQIIQLVQDPLVGLIILLTVAKIAIRIAER